MSRHGLTTGQSGRGNPVSELAGIESLSSVSLMSSVFLGSQPVRGEKSSRVTKVPLAESRRLFVTESKSSEYIERKDRKKKVKCRER